MFTFDGLTGRPAMDSAGAFLIGQLERLDPKVHEPLVSVTWPRDIDLRQDIQISDEYSSFTTTAWGVVGSGTNTAQGVSYVSSQTTAMGTPQIDVEKISAPLVPWGLAVQYSVLDLERSRRLGTPIDVQKLQVLNTKHQMDLDQLVYIGDSTRGTYGLVNNSTYVTAANVSSGSAGSPLFTRKSPAEILSDFNEMLIAAWAASGYALLPNKVLMAPTPFGYCVQTIVSSAGNRSIIDYLKDNNILKAERGIDLDIKACKWLAKANINGPTGSAATYDRMICYAQDPDIVRYPMAPLMPLAPQYEGMFIKVPYVGLVGAVEIVRPSVVVYRDGIN